MGDYKCAGCGKPIHCFTDDWDGCKACGCVTAEKVRETEKPAMTDNMQRARELIESLARRGRIDSDDAKMLTAALRLAVPEWRPIETAPTDETVVMAYFGPDEAMREFTSVARFFKWECMTERLLSGWPSQRRKPTHWAPLPAAPTVSAEGASDAHG